MAVKTQNTTHVVSVPPRAAGSVIPGEVAAIAAKRPTAVAIKAAGLQFATPREICGLRALIDLSATDADVVEVDCPERPEVNRYLERVDFYDGLSPNVVLSQRRPRFQRRDRRHELVELTRVRCGDDVERLMDSVSEIAKGQVGPGPLAKAFATAIAAATENVVDHADSAIGALVSGQRYQNAGLELAVVDLGHGIPATLARNPRHRGLSDLEAIERALEDGVSSILDEDRGIGLWELVGAVGKARNATLAIASGHGDLQLSWQNGRRTRNALAPAHQIRGTWISVRLEN